MIDGYKFLIPGGEKRVSVNSNSVRKNHYRFYAELLDYLVLYQNGGEFVVNLRQVEEGES